jgi:hypothetical protein
MVFPEGPGKLEVRTAQAGCLDTPFLRGHGDQRSIADFLAVG